MALGKTGGVPSAVPKPGESLADLFPDVAAQWHPTRNGELTPTKLSYGVGRRYWWKCDGGSDHEWNAVLASRTRAGNGCPFCTGLQASVTNSLEALSPEIAAEWHPTKNGEVVPANVVAGSTKKYWWKCDVADDSLTVHTVVGNTLGNFAIMKLKLKLKLKHGRS